MCAQRVGDIDGGAHIGSSRRLVEEQHGLNATANQLGAYRLPLATLNGGVKPSPNNQWTKRRNE
jgi:hypothetical protein